MTARLIMKLSVEKMRLTTPDVMHLQLVHPLRPVLPEWSAGAHVDLRLPDGRVRQYSLCGDPDDRSRYEIAIKRETTGRGGSIWAHENLREGSEVHISAPRNNLPLNDKGRRYILVAGGIGITPFLSMARTLKRQDKDFTAALLRALGGAGAAACGAPRHLRGKPAMLVIGRGPSLRSGSHRTV